MKRKTHHWLKMLAHSIVASIVALCLLVFGVLQAVWTRLPNIDDAHAFIASQSVLITDRTGRELYRLYQNEDRINISHEDLPDYIKHAIIAIEDERFYSRGCIDVRAIARALEANIHDFKSQGASTITQQLIRNSLLTNRKTFERKLQEIMLACRLESQMTKDEILNLYLNWIPFGGNTYGIEQASKTYFGTSTKDLSLAQAVVLAALPQRPTYFSPYGSHKYTTLNKQWSPNSTEPIETFANIGLLGNHVLTSEGRMYIGGRTDQVLANMERLGFISSEERNQALQELRDITFKASVQTISAPHFVFWLRTELQALQEEREALQHGMRVKTTIHPLLQQTAEEIVLRHAPEIEKQFNAQNIALVAVDRHTREILAYVGNTDYFNDDIEGKVDMAQAPRQTGSVFKPIIYAAAMLNGVTSDTIVYDAPVIVGNYRPQNVDGVYHGRMSIRDALGRSRNIPAFKAFFWAGGENSILQLARDLGAPYALKQKQALRQRGNVGFQYGWPLALGSAETPLLEMMEVYTSFANDGVHRPLNGIRSVRNFEGDVVLAASGERDDSLILPPEVSQQITDILSDRSARPEGYWRDLLTLPNIDAAVKTGTSNKCIEINAKGECTDIGADNAWVIGYSPEIVVGVLVGNTNSDAMHGEAGGLTVAGPVWRDFMLKSHELLAISDRSFYGDSRLAPLDQNAKTNALIDL